MKTNLSTYPTSDGVFLLLNSRRKKKKKRNILNTRYVLNVFILKYALNILFDQKSILH